MNLSCILIGVKAKFLFALEMENWAMGFIKNWALLGVGTKDLFCVSYMYTTNVYLN